MTISEVQDQIVEEFSIFDEWLDKYEYLIEVGKTVPGIEEKKKTKDKLIEGCQSRVWLNADLQDGLIILSADSDALITRGIVGLLIRVYNQRTPQEIMTNELTFIDRIGLAQNLSPTRANGLLSMIKQIKMYALAYDTILKK